MSHSLSSATQNYSIPAPVHLSSQTAPQLTLAPSHSMVESTATTATEHITPREQEIVCLVAFGLSNKQIATRLKISVWTVSAHLRRVFNKLKVDTRAAVVYKCAPMIQAQAKSYPEAIAQFYR